MIACEPVSLPEAVSEAVSRWIREQKARLFCLIVSGSVTRGLVNEIYENRRDFDNVETLDILLHSDGGDIEAAYQLVSFFRRRAKKLRIFVPDWAKSAATLLTLGADEIWMSETAELGPLDAQIPDPRDPHNFISALDEFRAIDYLRNHGYEIFDEFVRMLIRRSRLRIKDMFVHAIDYSTNIMAPLYSQVDPLYFGAAHRALEMSIQYGERVMSRYAYKKWSTAQIDNVLHELTWNYPSHSFVIDYEEAKRLGLKVNLLTGQIEDDAHVILNAMSDCIGFIDEKIIQAMVGPSSQITGGADATAHDNTAG